MLENLNEQKIELLQLMLWLVSHPPQESTKLITEALLHCQKEQNLTDEEMEKFGKDFQNQLGQLLTGEIPAEDARSQAIYQSFFAYLKSLAKN
jgi:hypothetical protein